MKAHQAKLPVTRLCSALGFSTSGYYAGLVRGSSARAQAGQGLTKQLMGVHEASRGTYGVPLLHAELRADGVRVGRKRIARLRQASCTWP